MTDIDATERFRTMLDERGVSHVDHGCNTAWTIDGKSYAALEQNDGLLSVAPLTPEQAIAATLGNPEIVRCKDCKHATRDGECMRYDEWHDDRWYAIEPDGFCKWGERKADK